MCTAAMQKNLPDFLTNLQGTSVSFPGRDGKPQPIRNATDVPLGDSQSADTASILQRRERIKQAQEHVGSHIPKGVRTRKDIMEEIT